ncbi:hypothetical protein QLQ12_41755 [Actinoplanes sp. NEAU-A12]|uniref:Deoxyribonuclease NucA/NucB domain-containing protein n=1 Tax=Actinoplanes sandaracinus TaxID=3045177 RepID=A0ABT6WZE7_9ACTN|nr:hypothetical protein [Actinoplanes sandaracinus]MDI6105130.1 hypothetical protein [Actinoplanes sandaracinus]
MECVIPDYEPPWDVNATNRPTFIRHMQSAEASGLRGFYPGGTPLTRLTDAGLRDQNGNTACPDRVNWPRPPGHSCDEYPFRSTHQGAFTGGGSGRTFDWCQITALPTGITGPNGYSSCMILAGENSSAGGLLNSFYINNRVIENDAFYTWVE